ncbi:glutathione S-transferase family protein, partial [Xanthomonas oryzae pv. oryzae]
MSTVRPPLTVHGMSSSGNCYKVRLLLEQLVSRYHWVEVDSVAGQTRTPAYLA